MVAATEFLSDQVDAYAQSWKSDRRDSIEQWELEGRVEVALALYRFIRAADGHWSDSVRAGAAQVNDAEAKSIGDLYSCWMTTAEDVLASIKSFESRGAAVERADEFRSACRRTRMILAMDVAAIQASFAEFHAGGGRPLEEVVDEIRRRHVNKGV